LLKSLIDKIAFCPRSERGCEGSSWTARQTKEDPITHLPVSNSTVLLEAHAVFEDNVKCESFISEWYDVCDSYTQMISVKLFMQGLDKNNVNCLWKVIASKDLTNKEVRDALEGLIKMGKGLEKTALRKIINVVEPFAEGDLTYLKKNLRKLWMRYEIRKHNNRLDDTVWPLLPPNV
jgi:hypothetical protein